jgi:hypothetical protein
VAAAGATVLPPDGPTFESTAPSTPAGTPTAAQPVLDPVIVPPPPPAPVTAGGSGGGLPRRTVVALVAAVVAVIALIGGFLVLGGDGGTEAVSTTTTQLAASSTTTTAAPGEPLLEVLTPASGAEATTSETELSGRADPGSTVTVDGVAVTVDAAGNWTQTVKLPAAETSFTIVVTTPTGGTKTVTWVVKRDAVAPALEITDPFDGAVLNNRVVTLRGTTELGTTVLVDGVGASPDAATSTDTVLGWLSDVTINGDQQTFTVTSTDAAGNVATKTITLHFLASAPPTLPRPRPPVTTNPPGSTTPPAPTLVAVNDDAGTWNYEYLAQISFNVTGNDSGDWNDIEYGGLSGGYGTLSRVSGGFFQYTMRDPGKWTESFQYRLRNTSTGAVSNWATVTFYIVCGC